MRTRRQHGPVDTDDVPEDDVMVGVLVSAIALTFSGLVGLLVLWH